MDAQGCAGAPGNVHEDEGRHALDRRETAADAEEDAHQEWDDGGVLTPGFDDPQTRREQREGDESTGESAPGADPDGEPRSHRGKGHHADSQCDGGHPDEARAQARPRPEMDGHTDDGHAHDGQSCCGTECGHTEAGFPADAAQDCGASVGTEHDQQCEEAGHGDQQGWVADTLAQGGQTDGDQPPAESQQEKRAQVHGGGGLDGSFGQAGEDDEDEQGDECGDSKDPAPVQDLGDGTSCGGPTAWPTPMAEAHAAIDWRRRDGQWCARRCWTHGGIPEHAMPCTTRAATRTGRFADIPARTSPATIATSDPIRYLFGPRRSASHPATGEVRTMATVNAATATTMPLSPAPVSAEMSLMAGAMIVLEIVPREVTASSPAYAARPGVVPVCTMPPLAAVAIDARPRPVMSRCSALSVQ